MFRAFACILVGVVGVHGGRVRLLPPGGASAGPPGRVRTPWRASASVRPPSASSSMPTTAASRVPAPTVSGERASEALVAGFAARQRGQGVAVVPRRAAVKLPARFDAPSDLSAPWGAEKSKSGLAWQVLVPGDGDSVPGSTSTVTVHYSGWTSKDGTLFDSSYIRNAPSQFKLSGVIQGWTEGVGMMRVGEKRRLWIPGELAYGKDDGVPGALQEGPPKGDLVFDVELLKVEDAGNSIVQGAGAVLGVLLLASFAFSATYEPPEKPEYDTKQVFKFTPWGQEQL